MHIGAQPINIPYRQQPFSKLTGRVINNKEGRQDLLLPIISQAHSNPGYAPHSGSGSCALPPSPGATSKGEAAAS
eukprot:6191063-Pleurochrysis_carterae.AAC.1